MAFSEFEVKRYSNLVEEFISLNGPPVHIHDQLKWGYRIEGQSIIIFEIRPRWDDPEEKIESVIAKTTFVKSKQTWKIYWQRADLRWHGYKPVPEVGRLEEFLAVVKTDEYCYFFG